jgi:diaminohydroxyphosphoribosylaminopyrimidine deaminase/5-amino-6-(5-phosphoribosylamino)uracil reductase
MTDQSKQDIHYIRETFKLAQKGRGRTSPNPLAGAVVVKDGQIVGKGYHHKAGEAHAEILALQEAGKRAQDATLYVNLEPCAHTGRTSPCVKSITEAGISRVVAAMYDPNPIVDGKGIAFLQQAGIDTTIGVLEEEALELNESFVKYTTTGLPFVTLKIAITLDGKIATKTGDSKWITSREARTQVHRLRNEVDATLVGIGTILRDNSRLTTRLKGKQSRDPIRIVVDSLLKVPLRANVFTEESDAGNIIVTTNKASVHARLITEIEHTGSKVLVVDSVGNNKVCLRKMLVELGKMGITSLMIEGGAEIAGSALDEGIVDKINFFIAPRIVGGKFAPGPVGGKGVLKISDATPLYRVKTKRFGDDLMVQGYLSPTA